ncbi:MAG: hypothetical protein HY319_03675 [Armatimonadetes bacterium]|nr:hypothetical protein [Armatimonadota bacterium]
MRHLLAIFLIVFLVLPALAWGPSGGGSSAPPLKPKKPAKSTPAKVSRPTRPVPPAYPPAQASVVSTVSYYVQAQSKDGRFPVPDPLLEGKSWQLKVEQPPTVTEVDARHYEVVTGFNGNVEGQPEELPVSLVFYLTGQDQTWRVTDVWIHSVNNVERPRTYVCPVHPGIGTFQEARCPIDGKSLK